MRRYKPVQLDTSLPTDEWRKQIEDNYAQLEEIDKECKEEGELLGRYIAEPFADGQAIYQITDRDDTKNLVQIEVCGQLGDDWQIPYWGPMAWIDENYARGSVKRRDGMTALFANAVGERAEPERTEDPEL